MEPFEETVRRGGGVALQHAGRFFMRDDPVNLTLHRIAAKLAELGIPYAIVGGMALVAHGYDRTTVDVDVLVTPDGLQMVHQQLEGLGYVPPFKGSKHLRDTDTGVRVEFLVTGGFPGDGKPKPVAFPDPQSASVEIDGIRYLKLPAIIELKIASGLTNPGRIKDLADVQELIRALRLPQEYVNNLNAYVQPKFVELWEAIHQGELPD